jgi:HEAT repeat protein
LKSSDPEIHYQAVSAAGNWELDAAWPHILGLLNDAGTSKPLLLAVIGAISSIRPQEAAELLIDLTESDDADLAEAANEVIAMSEPIPERKTTKTSQETRSIERL